MTMGNLGIIQEKLLWKDGWRCLHRNSRSGRYPFYWHQRRPGLTVIILRGLIQELEIGTVYSIFLLELCGSLTGIQFQMKICKSLFKWILCLPSRTNSLSWKVWLVRFWCGYRTSSRCSCTCTYLHWKTMTELLEQTIEALSAFGCAGAGH